MPTFSQNLPLIPTEYVPIDYSHDAQFALVEAQQAATNIAKVKSRYEDLLGMDLTNDKSKETLSTFMKSAEEDLRKISGMDMLVSSNATEALGVLKPLTQLEGPYGFIVVDNVFTKKYNNGKASAGAAKVKGENYNEAADDYLDIQKRRFQNTDDVNQWKYILNNTDDYTPYYDTQKELMDLVSKYKPNSIEADQTGGGRLVTTKDQSVYAASLQDFLEANLSDKYKAQKDLEAKVNFGKQQLLSYNPETKMYDGTKVYNYYDKLLTDIKTNRINIYNQEKNALQKEVTLLSNTSEGLKQQTELKKRIANIDSAIKRTNDEKLDKELFSNANDYRKAEAVAMNILAMKDLTDKAQSLAHLDISVTQKADEVYWKAKAQELEEKKFEFQKEKQKQDLEWDKQKELIKLGLKHINPITGAIEDGAYYTPQYKTDKTQEEMNSGADRGAHKLGTIADKLKSSINTGAMDFIDARFGVGFKSAMQSAEKNPEKFAGKTWGQVTTGVFKSLAQSETFNKFLLASGEKLYKLRGRTLLGTSLLGSKILSATDGGTTSRIVTEKGTYFLDKKTNKIYGVDGTFYGVHNASFTQEDLNKLPYDDVMQLAINSINAPTARAILKTSLSAKDYTSADIELQLAENNKSLLENKIKESLEGTIFEGLDGLDYSRINQEDYMLSQIDRAISNKASSLIGTNYHGGVVRNIAKDENGEWRVYTNTNGNGELLYDDRDVNSSILAKYFQKGSPGFWNSHFASAQDNANTRLLNKLYENFDNSTSNLNGLEKEQYAPVPELVPAKDRAGDKDLKDQWVAYRNNNLALVRSSNNPQKKIVGLVNDFPEAFIPVRDAEGYRFELNGAYVETVMTDIDKQRLFGRLDEVIGNWTSAVGSFFGDNIEDAAEAVEDLNKYVLAKDPTFFRVTIDGYDNSSFRSEQNAASILSGGGFVFKQNVPEEYADYNLNPLSLSVTNYGAATLSDAKLKLSGSILIPKVTKDGLIQVDEGGKVKVDIQDASDFDFTSEQLLAKPMEVVQNLAILTNAYASILSKLNNPPTGVKFKYINDLIDYAKTNNDKNLLEDLRSARLLK